MKSPEQARADYEEAREILILRLYVIWYGIKDLARHPWRFFWW